MNNQRVLKYDSSDIDDIHQWMDALVGSNLSDVEQIHSIQTFQVIYEAGSLTAPSWYFAIVVVNTVIE